jgi:fumarylpyruvate hydrolase
MTQIFSVPPPPLADIAGIADKFPIRRIFCVGRNYAEHAREMGFDPDREPPFFFTKWAETFVPDGGIVPYPQATANFHFEAELVVAIGASGRDVRPENTNALIYGYATGLDMTRRDVQIASREKGRPWDTGKNVEASSPMGMIHRASDVGYLETGRISLTVNGLIRQESDLSALIWPVADVIAFLSGYYRLEPGDLIYTGTPAGVGPVVSGEQVVVEIEGLSTLTVRIGEPAV